MRKPTILLVLALFALNYSKAQNTFPSIGRVGIYTTLPNVSLQVNGGARIGTITNYVNIDSATGNLSFVGTAGYRVTDNTFAFQSLSFPKLGLFFNADSVRIELRSKKGAPVFNVGANSGNGVFAGGVQIGNSTNDIPGNIRWTGTDFEGNKSGVWVSLTGGTGGGANTALSNLSVTSINQSLLPAVNNSIDLGSSSLTWRNGYFSGNVGIGTLNPIQKLDVSGDASFNGVIIGRGPGNMINNTTIGSGALTLNLTGNNNTTIGLGAMHSNTTGNNNTATGMNALYLNDGGSDNVAYGHSSLYTNASGSRNAAVGISALRGNKNGTDNTAIGFTALSGNVGGYYNTASGSSALAGNIQGSFNTALGYRALPNSNGDYNTAVGTEALFANGPGSQNTALGYNSNLSSGFLINATVIGANAVVDASNKVRIGSAAVTSIGGQVSWTTFSDGRYKKNIKENVPGLKFINNLQPITYTVDINELNKHNEKGVKRDSIHDKMEKDYQPYVDEASKIVYNGFIAQDVEAAAKKLNYEFSGLDKPKSKDGLYGLRYADFVVPLVKAVQELSKKNDDLQKQIDDLKGESNYQSEIIPDAVASHQVVELTLSARVEQNTPNPFNKSTTIKYYLPVNNGKAFINFYTVSGDIFKTVKLLGSGNGSIDLKTTALPSGTYFYNLVVDGKQVDKKQMMQIK